MDFPNFNFSVSHHGDYVAIASEPLCLVGLDVVSYMIPCKEPVVEFVQNFSSYFSSFEWDNILNAGTCDEILIEFYRYGSASCLLSYLKMFSPARAAFQFNFQLKVAHNQFSA